MIGRKTEGMVAMRLTTDKGAVICTMTESEAAKVVAAKAPGIYVVCQSCKKKANRVARKSPPGAKGGVTSE